MGLYKPTFYKPISDPPPGHDQIYALLCNCLLRSCLCCGYPPQHRLEHQLLLHCPFEFDTLANWETKSHHWGDVATRLPTSEPEDVMDLRCIPDLHLLPWITRRDPADAHNHVCTWVQQMSNACCPVVYTYHRKPPNKL